MKFIHTYKYFILFIFLLSCTFDSGHSTDQKMVKGDPKEIIASISWIDSVINLGTMKMGDTVVFRFRFKNIGKVPIVVGSVETGCSCTKIYPVPKAIAPGAAGEIRALFDTRKSIIGFARKVIYVSTNTLPTKKELIYGGEITGHKPVTTAPQ